MRMKLRIRGAAQIVQVVSDGRHFLKGDEMKSLAILERAADGEEGLSVVVGADGLIAGVGTDAEMSARFSSAAFDRELDLGGHGCVVPGLVDGHTHPVWAGDRVHEFAMKLAGASYMEVHAAGGGINFTVEKTRAASEDDLVDLLVPRLDRMLKAGTTTAECKSGYGLDVETEVKMLRALERARERTKVEISSTFCGAHSVPKGKTAEEAAADVIKFQLPEVARLNASGALRAENVDVFCETGVFDVDQTRRILEAGKRAGLRINFHGEELSCLGSAEMGAELGSAAISHLEEVSPAGIAAMASAGTVAVILPTTAYVLRLKSPPVRAMLDAGVIVALGSDFNPNAYCMSMPAVMHLACVNLRMSLPESLAAATINAAHSLGRSGTHGSVEVGKTADLVVVDENRWEHLVYQFAGHDSVIAAVVKGGEVVHEKKRN